MKKIYLSLLAAVFAMGCGEGFEGDLSGSGSGSSDVIGVDVSMADDVAGASGNATRGTIISSVTSIPSVGLYGFFAGDEAYNIENDNMTKSEAIFSPSETFYWPSNYADNASMQFFAYSPYADTATNGLTIENTTSSSSLKISYVVPTTVVDQPDLLIASASASSGRVPLTFYHALATIKFKVIGGGLRNIKSIKLNNIKIGGTLTVTPTINLTESAWSDPLTGAVTISTTDGLSDKTPSETPQDITTSDGYLMMPPQTVAAGSSIVLTFSDDKEETINFPTTQTWEASKTYTYIINAGNIDFTNDNPSNCYILNPSNKNQICYIPIEGRINDFWTNYENNSAYRINNGDNWYVDILWSDIEATSELQNKGFKVERVTEGYANTTDNKSALKVTLPAAFNSTEKDENGNPKMHGSIVVGIRKGEYSERQDNYCWSWHFWITDYNPYTVTSNPTGENQVASTNDGGKLFTYGTSYVEKNPGKWIMDRTVGAVSANNYATTNTLESARGILYYQYGRKDPFTIYPNGTKNLNNVSDSALNTGKVKNGVLNPTKLAKGSYNGITDNDSSYQSTSYPWSDKKAGSKSDKSIFDPSPLGWKLPENGTWDGFSTSTFPENESYHARKYTVSGSTYAYYPASGYIGSSTGMLHDSGSNGYCWSCSPNSLNYGYNLHFNSSTVYPSDPYTRGAGRPVISVQE